MEQKFFNEESVFNCQGLPELEDPEVSSDQLLEISDSSAQSNKVDGRDTSIEPLKFTKRIGKGTLSLLSIKRKPKLRKSKNAKKIKPTKSSIGSDYKKNICGYVSKKLMREFIGFGYSKKVEQICQAENADYETTINFYAPKIERVTGPSHIPPLMTPKSIEQIPCIRVFITFFKWFLEERYVRHLFIEGKMELKRAYIEYKNRELLPLIWQSERNFLRDSQNLSPIVGTWQSSTGSL